AVRSASRLSLYVDGELVSQTPKFDASGYSLDCDAPLKLGTGIHGDFHGLISGARLYQRALDATEIELLSQKSPPSQP
ncbi:MAG TPA: LamG-like jellyroll fold domain-containing protein, partial [Planctomycetaceae bacterium]|nr:LamG-like jellyroll fold domain-containing protein [Planctomycetaceae bacterium]